MENWSTDDHCTASHCAKLRVEWCVILFKKCLGVSTSAFNDYFCYCLQHLWKDYFSFDRYIAVIAVFDFLVWAVPPYNFVGGYHFFTETCFLLHNMTFITADLSPNSQFYSSSYYKEFLYRRTLCWSPNIIWTDIFEQTTKFNMLANYLHCHYSLNFKESRGYSNVINA